MATVTATTVSAAATLVLAACAALAQDDDVPLPPRIDAAQTPPPESRARRPDATRLAPLPEDRPVQDEIVVVGTNEWRLPDLGSDWRAQQEAERAAAARIQVTFFPLYDPEEPAVPSDLFLVNRDDQRRHGVIEVFRLRFGRRGRE